MGNIQLSPEGLFAEGGEGQLSRRLGEAVVIYRGETAIQGRCWRHRQGGQGKGRSVKRSRPEKVDDLDTLGIQPQIDFRRATSLPLFKEFGEIFRCLRGDDRIDDIRRESIGSFRFCRSLRLDLRLTLRLGRCWGRLPRVPLRRDRWWQLDSFRLGLGLGFGLGVGLSRGLGFGSGLRFILYRSRQGNVRRFRQDWLRNTKLKLLLRFSSSVELLVDRGIVRVENYEGSSRVGITLDNDNRLRGDS